MRLVKRVGRWLGLLPRAGEASGGRKAESIAEHRMKPKGEVSGHAQSAGYNDPRQLILRGHQGVIDTAQGNVDHTLPEPTRDEPIHELNRRVVWVNDFRALGRHSSGQWFF